MNQAKKPQKLLNSKTEAAFALGVSPRTMDNLIARKLVRSVKIGGRRLIHEHEIQRLARGETEVA
jgi:excisionase family DNA binding protein